MLILPFPPRRGWLQSFALALGVLGGLAVTASAAGAGMGGSAVLLGGLGAVVMAAVGLLWPGLTRVLYSRWNSCAVLVARAASAVVRRLCFYVVLVAVGRAGSVLEHGRPTAGRSLWVRRNGVGGGTYLHSHRAGSEGAPPRGWVRAYIRWAMDSNNAWAVCLLPFWVLLSAFRCEEAEAGVPTHTYTLY